MTHERIGWAAIVLAASAVATLTAHRSRSVPSLRPAAVAVGAFAVLDVARLAGLPPAIDVVAFVAMSGLWMALLSNRRWTPLAVCLGFAAALLALRHEPTVLAHWHGLLQAPRVVGFALSLLVALRGGLDASGRIGVTLALGAGVCVAGGLWGAWWQVQVMAALSWVVVAALALRAR